MDVTREKPRKISKTLETSDMVGVDELFQTDNDRPFLEQKIFGSLRLWHISGMILGAVLIIIISLCCLCKCRIPRTRKEIEANAKRRRDRKKKKGRSDPEDEESTPLTGGNPNVEKRKYANY